MVKRLIAFCLLFNYPLCAMDDNPEILMFVGNPGVGKSSTINALKQEIVAKADVTLGSGLTQFFTKYKHQHQGKSYFLFDTPGLDDMKIREQAAVEIEKALKQEGTYKLFFVITLEAGRVKPSDIATIEMVMDAIKREGKSYNVIINKISKLEKNALSLPSNIDILFQQINSGKYKTANIFYIDLDRDLADGDKSFFKPSIDFENFIYRDSQGILIKKVEVEKIKIDKFEEIKMANEQELNKLKEELKAAQSRPPQVIHHHHHNSGGGGRNCAIQ